MTIKIESGRWFKSDDSGIATFSAKCGKCGSENVSIVNSLAMGSDWTGMYGSIDMVCRDCGNTAEIYS